MEVCLHIVSLALDSCHVCHHGSWDWHWRLGHSNPSMVAGPFSRLLCLLPVECCSWVYPECLATVCCADNFVSERQHIRWYWSVYLYMAVFILNSCIIALCSEDKCFFEWRFSNKSALVYVMRLLSLQDVRLKHSVLSNPWHSSVQWVVALTRQFYLTPCAQTGTPMIANALNTACWTCYAFMHHAIERVSAHQFVNALAPLLICLQTLRTTSPTILIR